MDKTTNLQPTLERLQQENTELKAKLAWFEEQFRLSKQKRFGSSSEKTNTEQFELFNEAELEADPTKQEPTIETI